MKNKLIESTENADGGSKKWIAGQDSLNMNQHIVMKKKASDRITRLKI